MENLVPIGRFSKMTRLSVRARRHYDELGLLVPADVEPSSGYRYYTYRQANRADTGTIAEQDARYVRIDNPATARLVTGQQGKGRIRYVSPVADEGTRTFTVELEVPNPGGQVPAGVTTEMQIPAGEMLAQKVSPAILSLAADGQIGVNTVDGQGRVIFTPVEIARSEADGVWVTGLPASANIITVGQGYVTPGQTVEAVAAQEETALAADGNRKGTLK